MKNIIKNTDKYVLLYLNENSVSDADMTIIKSNFDLGLDLITRSSGLKFPQGSRNIITINQISSYIDTTKGDVLKCRMPSFYPETIEMKSALDKETEINESLKSTHKCFCEYYSVIRNGCKCGGV